MEGGSTVTMGTAVILGAVVVVVDVDNENSDEPDVVDGGMA